MTKKLHLTKLEEAETEVGIQLKDSSPPTGLENRIFINKVTGEMRAYLNGQDVHLSFNVYEQDPASPAEKQVWLNSNSRSLKWHFGGVTQSIALDDALKVASQGTLSTYLGTLTQVELEQIADVSTVLPNYLVDAFNGDEADSVLSDVEEKDSSIKVSDGFNTGTYELEKRVSPAYNYAEGIAVIKSQALRPKTVTDLTDGTHEVVFQGDVTDILWDGGELLAYEQELDEADRITSYFLLDGDLDPARLPIGTVTYDNIAEETTAIITNNGLDITLGFTPAEYGDKLRFKPLNLKVEAGSNGLLGAMTEIAPNEVEGLSGLSAVLGEEQFTKISTELAQENIIMHRIEHSPNKQNWILQVMCENNDNGRTAGSVYMWYSTDGFQTINFIRDWVGYTSSPSVDQILGHSQYQNHGHDMWFSNRQIKINDDGRYVFSYKYYDPSSTWTNILYFGDVSRPDKEPVLFNQNFGAYAGCIGFEQNNTYSYHLGTIEVDWEYNMMLAFGGRTNEDAYTWLFEIDWANNSTYPRSYLGWGADHFQYPVQGISGIKEFEGEMQWFGLFEHGTNQLLYGRKWRFRRLIDEINSGVYTGVYGTRGNTGNIGATTSPSDGEQYAGYMFSNDLEGGNRHGNQNYFHQRDYLRPMDFGWDKDDDTLIMLSEDANNAHFYLHGINFGRTTYGAPNETDITFDAVPDSGNFTLDVTDVLTATTETTSPIPFSADENQVRSIIEAITFIGVGNVEVTGNFSTGFEIRLSLFRRQEIHFVLNTNSLTQTAVPVNITVTELEAGFRPVWLRHDNHTANTELYNPANGLAVRLDTAIYAQLTQSSGDRNHTDYSRERSLGQQIWVRGKKVIAHVLTRRTSNAHDTLAATIIKIPDYTQLYGSGTSENRIYSPGSNAQFHLSHKNHSAFGSFDRAARFAQKFNAGSNPFSMYADGKIHIRTMLLHLYAGEVDTSESRIRRPTFHDATVRMRLMPVGDGGVPDWDNPIAISSEIKWNDLPNKSDYKWCPFTFPNVKLEPNTDYFWGFESLGIDMLSDLSPNSDYKFECRLGGRDITTSNTMFAYKPDAGGWVSTNGDLWFKWFDYYINYTHNMHESGFNHAFKQNKHEWVDGSNGVEATIHPRGNDDAELYLASYRITGGYYPNDYSGYSHVQGGSHAFVFEIDDTGNAEDLPIVRDPEVLGWDGSDQWDRNLVFAFAYGLEDEYSLNRNTDGTFYKYSSAENDYEYNRSSHFGGHQIGHDSNMGRRKEYSGAGNGIEDDPDFRYGKCCHFNGAGGSYIYNHSLDMTPWQNDFIWECEFKPESQDLDGSNNMLFSSHQLLYIMLDYGRLSLYAWYNGTGRYVRSDQLIEQRYQRLRVIRDWDNGVRFFRNYDAIGGTWEELTTSGYKNAVLGDFFKHGAVMGDSDYNRTYYAIGRYTENTSHHCYGRMGYMKLAIGATEFAYDGLNFDQRPAYKMVNHGEFINAQRVLVVGQPSIYDRSMGDYGVYKHNVRSAKSRSNFTVLKYRDSVAAGRNMSVKLTLNKASDNDPSAVEGYLLSFYKK